jgi:hypothetical protein
MTTQQVADRLVALCREGKFEEAQNELYARDATSDEPPGAPVGHVAGLDGIIEKGRQFAGMTEAVHGIEVSDPIIGGNAFACTLRMDITMKGKNRSNMEEVCVYTVKDGKIVSERFAS